MATTTPKPDRPTRSANNKQQDVSSLTGQSRTRLRKSSTLVDGGDISSKKLTTQMELDDANEIVTQIDDPNVKSNSLQALSSKPRPSRSTATSTPQSDRILRSATKTQRSILMGPRPRNYLERLPLEVRQMIYRHLLIWPEGDMHVDSRKRNTRVIVSWNGIATRSEMNALKKSLDDSNFMRQNLPQNTLEDIVCDCEDKIRGKTVKIQIDTPLTKPPMLFKFYEHTINGLEGLALLRTYIPIDKKPWTTFRKTLSTLCSSPKSSLQQERKPRQPPLPKYFSVLQRNELFDRTPHLNENPHYIPSLHSSIPLPDANTTQIVDNKPKRYSTNPLPQFFREIGPLNASKIHKMTLTDDFWVVLLSHAGDYSYTSLLLTITPHLSTLVLRQQFYWVIKSPNDSDYDSNGDDEEDEGEEDNEWKTWTGNGRGDGSISRRDWKSKRRQGKVDRVVEEMVGGLKGLRTLRLEFASQDRERDDGGRLSWGKTLRWVESVAQR